MKLLLTAFTPFDGEKINPALEAVKLVKDKIGNLLIVKLEVPTVFGKSIDTVREAIEREKPDFVLSIGQAGGRAEITPERVAINLNDARIPDNEGNQPIDEPVFPDGENAYFSTLPVKAMVEAIREEGIPSSLSNSAGTFVCNHLMYGVLYYLDKRPVIKAGFIHVPYIPEQVKNKKEMPALELSEIVRGLEAAITAIAINGTDKKLAYGQND
ncbi:pyroglutamyl-peptidase I [Oribacterium parvum ACB1]|uniref:Pyrrolidone-carboxylate peptidase n=1 Tax=Oribacterium parvum ACB1 TaxID=796943 RepID=G9WMF9_9FIRM|nr:pyroglutamyl-peptidase I [Oribacterium parvum]EHL11712.1 pyroglutamyl-peptidase I [Oribacterium parvum ACB1]EJF13695.1 pyroglutamyl-peptidase I [Oribacterium parvum ACB8]